MKDKRANICHNGSTVQASGWHGRRARHLLSRGKWANTWHAVPVIPLRYSICYYLLNRCHGLLSWLMYVDDNSSILCHLEAGIAQTVCSRVFCEVELIPASEQWRGHVPAVCHCLSHQFGMLPSRMCVNYLISALVYWETQFSLLFRHVWLLSRCSWTLDSGKEMLLHCRRHEQGLNTVPRGRK